MFTIGFGTAFAVISPGGGTDDNVPIPNVCYLP